jgi:hypothetical protein
MFPRQQLYRNRKTMFCTRTIPRWYKQNKLGINLSNPMPRGITGLPSSLVIPVMYELNLRGTWPSRLGESQNRDNEICSWIPWDSDPRKTALGMPSKNWKLQTRLLVREGAPNQQTRKYLKVIKERTLNGCESQMGAWHQDRLADWLSIVMWHWLWLWLWLELVCQLVSYITDGFQLLEAGSWNRGQFEKPEEKGHLSVRSHY